MTTSESVFAYEGSERDSGEIRELQTLQSSAFENTPEATHNGMTKIKK
jgi:hypothetical protein